MIYSKINTLPVILLGVLGKTKLSQKFYSSKLTLKDKLPVNMGPIKVYVVSSH